MRISRQKIPVGTRGYIHSSFFFSFFTIPLRRENFLGPTAQFPGCAAFPRRQPRRAVSGVKVSMNKDKERTG
jgi:hypothetical protein